MGRVLFLLFCGFDLSPPTHPPLRGVGMGREGSDRDFDPSRGMGWEGLGGVG
jgi:hypothetical protein